MTFTEPFDEGGVPPLFEFRSRIREWLATWQLVRHLKNGHVELLPNKLPGQVAMGSYDGLATWIDGERYAWPLLRSYEGWSIRIEICDPGRE